MINDLKSFLEKSTNQVFHNHKNFIQLSLSLSHKELLEERLVHRIRHRQKLLLEETLAQSNLFTKS